MSFREKSAWISMLSMSAIYGFYFWSIAGSGGLRHAAGFHSGPLLLGTVVALVVVQIVLHTLIAIQRPAEAQAPRDEREKLIDLKSTRIAYHGLATGVALACFFGAFTPAIVFDTNALLFILVTAEILRAATQIICFRRSA
jgi:hypothetical protein